MRPWLRKSLRALRTIAYRLVLVAIALGLVVWFPPIAVGFLAAYVGRWGRNAYESVILGSIAAAFAVVLMANMAELAVLAAVFPVSDALSDWRECVRTA